MTLNNFFQDSLGKRLEDEGDPVLNMEAQLCFIVASNVEQLVANFEKNVDSSSHQKLQVIDLLLK